MVQCLPTRYPLNLIAWPISSLPAEAKAYPKIHQQPYCTVSSPPHINDAGNSFIHMLVRMQGNLRKVTIPVICICLLFMYKKVFLANSLNIIHSALSFFLSN